MFPNFLRINRATFRGNLRRVLVACLVYKIRYIGILTQSYYFVNADFAISKTRRQTIILILFDGSLGFRKVLHKYVELNRESTQIFTN